MREICLARLDKTRPVLVLTRDLARHSMTKVTVAPITSTMKGLSSEVPLGARNGLDHDCAASLDNVLTIPTALLGRTIGFLGDDQEPALARAIVLAYDLDIPLLAGRPAPLVVVPWDVANAREGGTRRRRVTLRGVPGISPVTAEAPQS